jgi:hypothetical protein
LTSGPNTVNGNYNGLPAKIPLEDILVILRFPDGTEKKIPGVGSRVREGSLECGSREPTTTTENHFLKIGNFQIN